MTDSINREQGDGNGHASGHSLPLLVRGRVARRSKEYRAGYAAGYQKARNNHNPEIQYVYLPRPEPTGELKLRNGGRIIIEGAVEITEEELKRVQGWLGVHLIISPNSPLTGNPCPADKTRVDG